MYRGVGDTDGFLFVNIPHNHHLALNRSLGEMIQHEVRNVTKAAAEVMGLTRVGMIAEQCCRRPVIPMLRIPSR